MIFGAIPFAKESFHLKMIENGFAEGIDSFEQQEIGMVFGREHAVEHHPLGAFTEIVF